MAGAKKMKMSLKRRRSTPATCPSKAPAPSWMLLAAFAILVLLAVTLIYQYFVRSPRQEGFKSKQEKQQKRASESFDVPSELSQGSKATATATLVFLYMNGCGWCDKFKPEWERFSSTYGPSLTANGVVMVSYERSEAGATQYENYVQGYPTVLLAKSDGNATVFQGDRTPQGLAEFLNQNGYAVKQQQA